MKDRNIVARTGLEKALKAKPAAFYSKRSAQLITIGNIEDDLAKLADVDWIVDLQVSLALGKFVFTDLCCLLQQGRPLLV